VLSVREGGMTLLCWLGLHNWEPILRGYFEDAAYWLTHGELPRDEAVCLRCGKRRFFD
jgi:hypothetical protein